MTAVGRRPRREGPLLFGFVIIEEQKNRFQSVRCGATYAIGIVRTEGYQTPPLFPPSMPRRYAAMPPLKPNSTPICQITSGVMIGEDGLSVLCCPRRTWNLSHIQILRSDAASAIRTLSEARGRPFYETRSVICQSWE